MESDPTRTSDMMLISKLSSNAGKLSFLETTYLTFFLVSSRSLWNSWSRSAPSPGVSVPVLGPEEVDEMIRKAALQWNNYTQQSLTPFQSQLHHLQQQIIHSEHKLDHAVRGFNVALSPVLNYTSSRSSPLPLMAEIEPSTAMPEKMLMRIVLGSQALLSLWSLFQTFFQALLRSARLYLRVWCSRYTRSNIIGILNKYYQTGSRNDPTGTKRRQLELALLEPRWKTRREYWEIQTIYGELINMPSDMKDELLELFSVTNVPIENRLERLKDLVVRVWFIRA